MVEVCFAIRLQNDAFGNIIEQNELLSLLPASRWEIHQEDNGYSGEHTHIILWTKQFQNKVHPNGELKVSAIQLLSKWLLNHRNKQHKSERLRRILKVQLCQDVEKYTKYINKQNDLYYGSHMGLGPCQFDL